MTRALALDLLFLATVLVYGAGSERGRARLWLLQARAGAFGARAAAVLFTGLAIACWQRVEPGPEAFLVALVGLMALASAVALLGPLRPRWLWGCALSGALALPFLFYVGGLR